MKVWPKVVEAIFGLVVWAVQRFLDPVVGLEVYQARVGDICTGLAVVIALAFFFKSTPDVLQAASRYPRIAWAILGFCVLAIAIYLWVYFNPTSSSAPLLVAALVAYGFLCIVFASLLTLIGCMFIERRFS